MKRNLARLLLASGLGLLAAVARSDDDVDERRESMRAFLLDDFGSNSLHATRTFAAPWKLYSTALLLSEAPRLGLPVEAASLRPVLEQFGFMFPERIGNWPGGSAPIEALSRDPFFGQTRGRLRGLGVEVRNLGCGLCHAGRLFDAQGLPSDTAWIGLPNGSIDIQAYGVALMEALRAALARPESLTRAMKRVYPEMSRREAIAYSLIVIPRVRREMRRIERGRSEPLPFDQGEPGVMNGAASLKLQLGLISLRAFSPDEHAITNIPDLANRAFRTSLLADGIYVRPGRRRFEEVDRVQASESGLAGLAEIATFFSVSTAGNSVTAAERAIPRVRKALAGFRDYEPPPFPAVIDKDLAARGRGVFVAHCEECHGSYEAGSDGRYRLVSYPNRLIGLARINSDPLRARVVDASIKGFLAKNPTNAFVRRVGAAETGGYVAPILSGVWATAPYLHNGSVPTLFALMHPEERPERFELGGHALDYERMGIALVSSSDGVSRYPAGYKATSRRAVYDTRRPGRSNRGHEFDFEPLTEGEKRSLLEFLKTL